LTEWDICQGMAFSVIELVDELGYNIFCIQSYLKSYGVLWIQL